MYEDIKDKELYHICIYKDYMLEVGKEYDTTDIKRDYKGCGECKQKRELDFEKYRMINCSHLPSRANCFYVCLKKDVEIFLRKLLSKCLLNQAYKIFKTSCTGTIFWADVDFFDDPDEASPQKYWDGCDSKDLNATIEGLFIGKYKVVKECTQKFLPPR